MSINEPSSEQQSSSTKIEFGSDLQRFDSHAVEHLFGIKADQIAFVSVTLFQGKHVLFAPQEATIMKVKKSEGLFTEPVPATEITNVKSRTTVFFKQNPVSVMECETDSSGFPQCFIALAGDPVVPPPPPED